MKALKYLVNKHEEPNLYHNYFPILQRLPHVDIRKSVFSIGQSCSKLVGVVSKLAATSA